MDVDHIHVDQLPGQRAGFGVVAAADVERDEADPCYRLARAHAEGGGCFQGRFDGLDTVAAVVEREPGAWVEPAARRLRSETGRSARVLVLQVPRYAIPRTSSGKPRRRLLGQELMEGTLPATTLVDWRQGIS